MDTVHNRLRDTVRRLQHLENTMTPTYDYHYGHVLGQTEQASAWAEYVGGGDYQDGPGYTADELRNAVAEALFAEQVRKFNTRLPDGFTWIPQTSSILGPVDRADDLPDEEDAEEWMREICDEIEKRYDEIEATTVAELTEAAK